MLTHAQVITMRRAGFLKSEIRAFNNARAPDGSYQDTKAIFKSKPFQVMLKDRAAWWRRALTPVDKGGYGYTRTQATYEILGYYRRRGQRSPFDFLKAEYKPPKKLTDFQYATRLRVRARITKSLGKGYTRPLKKEWRPRMDI